MKKTSIYLIVVLLSSVLVSCNTSQIPKEVLENNLVLQEENMGIELFYQTKEEDMLKGFYLKDQDKTAFYDWSNVSNETYYPQIYRLEDGNIAISLVTGYGSGCLQSEIHIFNLSTWEEVECKNPMKIIEENLAMEYQKNKLMISQDNKHVELPLPEEDLENLFPTPGIGAMVHYQVIDHVLNATVSIQLTPAYFAGTVNIQYQFENGRYVFTTLQIEESF